MAWKKEIRSTPPVRQTREHNSDSPEQIIDSAGVTYTRNNLTEGFIEDSADARSYRRRSVLWPARMVVGEHEFRCQVWNMSLGGARIKIDIPIKPGTEILLRVMGRADLPATVQWCDAGAVGLCFTIDPEEVRLLFLDRAQMLGLDGR